LTGLAASLCAGVAIWCSLGTIGLMGEPPAITRVALLASGWVVPLAVPAVFMAIRALRLSTRQQLPLFGSTILVLPWLPFRLPAAALLWTGPLTVVVWATVTAGLVIECLRGARGPRWAIDPRRAPLVAAALSLALYGASAVWLSPILPDGDEPHYLILAQSLIKDGDLRIENNHRQGDYLEYSLNAAAPDYLRRGVNGEIYSIHAPGLAVLIAPAMWLFGYPGVVAFLALIAALSTALVWHVAYQITESAACAWFGWAACALTAPLFFQATEVFPDGIAATCLLIGTLPLWDGLERPSTFDFGPWPWNAKNRSEAKDAKVQGLRMKVVEFVSGTSLAILPWLQTRLAVLAIAAAICVCLRLRCRRQLFAFTVAPVISATLWLAFFIVVYGTPNPTAPYGPYTQTSPANLFRGFPGLLFDQQFGLIPNAPIYGFVLIGVIAAAVKRRRWGWETLTLTVPYMAAVGSYQMWWGGTSVPARLLTPLMLVLGVSAAKVWRDIRARGTKTLGILTLLASVLITIALVGPEHGRLLLNFRDGISLWLEWANDVVDLPRALPSLFHDAPAQLWLKVLIWGLTVAALWFTLRLIGPRKDQHSTSPITLPWQTTWTAAIALMIACTLAWRVDGAQPFTPQTAALNLLRHASSGRMLAYDFSASRLRKTPELLWNLRIGTDRQRRPVNSPTLFTARAVPAGSYGIQLDTPMQKAGRLDVHVGSTPLAILTVPTTGLSEQSGAVLLLPTNIRALTIDGDVTTARSGAAVELRPLASATDDSGGSAHRAASYDSASVFFLDEHAYPEPTGFWVAGGRSADVIIANRSNNRDLFVRNAPVDNRVTLDINGKAQELRLGPGQEQLVRLQPSPNSQLLRVRVSPQTGFRPSTTEAGSTDQRYLGAWIEVR
jgi:hypothetical protein